MEGSSSMEDLIKRSLVGDKPPMYMYVCIQVHLLTGRSRGRGGMLSLNNVSGKVAYEMNDSIILLSLCTVYQLY